MITNLFSLPCFYFLTSDNNLCFPIKHKFPCKSNQRRTKWKDLNFSLSLILLFSLNLLTDFYWTWYLSYIWRVLLSISSLVFMAVILHLKLVMKQNTQILTNISYCNMPYLCSKGILLSPNSHFPQPALYFTPYISHAPSWTFGPSPSRLMVLLPPSMKIPSPSIFKMNYH